ncbi:MAG: hypothetical protein ACTSQE_13605 [Candidatus Heimdallarchaeaceae archaeon]
MPYYNFKGARESKTMHSEAYKSEIEKYLAVAGYIKQNDSAIEGCLSDMIFKNPQLDGQRETYVEAKWTEFSVNNSVIRKEFIDYLLLYFRIPADLRFKFFIFARDVSNESFHKDLFEKYKKNAVLELYYKILKDLKGEDYDLFVKLDYDEFIKFLWDTTLINSNIENLKMKILEITGEYPLEKNVHLRYKALTNTENICEKTEIIYSNAVKISKFSQIWMAETTYKDSNEIKETIEHPPPYYLYENRLLSLYPFKDYNTLSEIIKPNTIEKISIKSWIDDKDRRNVLTALLNRSITKLCQLRGLYKTLDKNHIYYFPNINGDDSKEISWLMIEKYKEKGQIKRKERWCSRKVYKKYAEKSFHPYFMHIGLNISAIFIENEFYYTFLPKKVFTYDGINLVSSERKRVLEQKFRTPKYSYNRNLLLEQLFWAYVLFLDPNIKQNQLQYLDKRSEEINFHTIQILNLLGLDYFQICEIDKSPVIEDDEITEEKPNCLNAIFNLKILED